MFALFNRDNAIDSVTPQDKLIDGILPSVISHLYSKGRFDR